MFAVGDGLDISGDTLSRSNEFTEQTTLSGGLHSRSVVSDLSYSTINASDATISGNPTFTDSPNFTEPIYIGNTGSTVKGALCFDVANNLPRLKLRMNGVDYIFNCDASVTAGSG